MIVESERFGRLELPEADAIAFPRGLIGFPEEREFVLLAREGSERVAWLQSMRTPALAFPVVSAHGLGVEYPDVPLPAPWGEAPDLAVLAVLAAPTGGPATVNLMAPVIVNAATRRGEQVLLEGTRFSARELYVVRQ